MACLNSCAGITYSGGVLRSASILLLEIACKNNRIPQQQHPDRYGKTVSMFVEGGCVRRHSQLTPLSGLIYAVFHADSPVLYKLCYLAYTFLPSPISGPLVVITYLIKAHCDKGEYISFPAHQRSPDQRDWDVESEALVTEGEHDEANTGGERNIINSEPPDPCELDVESESEVENDEASNAGESCNTYSEVPNVTQEMSV